MTSIGVVVAALVLGAGFKGALGNVSVSGMDASRSEFYAEHVAQQLTSAGVPIVTQKQMSALLGMERQRQLMGCSDGSSCIAEIASALGADGVVLGEIARLEGGGYQVSLKIVWAHDGRPLTTFEGRSADEPGLVDLLTRGSQLMAQDLAAGDWARLTTSPASHRIVPSSRLRTFSVAPAALAFVAGGVAIFGAVRSTSISAHLVNDTFSSAAEARAVAREGSTMQGLALGLGITAVALLAVAAVMFFLGGS